MSCSLLLMLKKELCVLVDEIYNLYFNLFQAAHMNLFARVYIS